MVSSKSTPRGGSVRRTAHKSEESGDEQGTEDMTTKHFVNRRWQVMSLVGHRPALEGKVADQDLEWDALKQMVAQEKEGDQKNVQA